MNNKIEGIVLRQTEYRDSDMILSLFTREFGKISLLARGIKKMNSKNAPSCSLFSYSTFYIHENDKNNFYTLKTAERKRMFSHIYGDLIKQSCAQMMCECIEKICDEPHENMFTLLLKGLSYLEEGKDPLLVLTLFMVHCNAYCGVEANVDECVKCHATSNIVSFSCHDGGFLCAHCYDELTHKRFKEQHLRALRLLHKAGIDDFDVLMKYVSGSVEDLKLIVSIFEEYSGIHLRSFAFLLNILEM